MLRTLAGECVQQLHARRMHAADVGGNQFKRLRIIDVGRQQLLQA